MNNNEAQQIEYKGRLQNLEEVLNDAAYDVEHGNRESAMHAIICLQNFGIAKSDNALLEKCQKLNEQLNIPTYPHPPLSMSQIAASDNNLPFQNPIYTTEGKPRQQVYVKEGYYGKMAQLLQCAHDDGWFIYENGDAASNREDTIYTIGRIFGCNYKQIYTKLNKVYSQHNYLEVFDDLKRHAEKYRQEKLKK